MLSLRDQLYSAGMYWRRGSEIDARWEEETGEEEGDEVRMHMREELNMKKCEISLYFHFIYFNFFGFLRQGFSV